MLGGFLFASQEASRCEDDGLGFDVDDVFTRYALHARHFAIFDDEAFSCGVEQAFDSRFVDDLGEVFGTFFAGDAVHAASAHHHRVRFGAVGEIDVERHACINEYVDRLARRFDDGSERLVVRLVVRARVYIVHEFFDGERFGTRILQR